jgi:hypothetical protein
MRKVVRPLTSNVKCLAQEAPQHLIVEVPLVLGKPGICCWHLRSACAKHPQDEHTVRVLVSFEPLGKCKDHLGGGGGLCSVFFLAPWEASLNP